MNPRTEETKMAPDNSPIIADEWPEQAEFEKQTEPSIYDLIDEVVDARLRELGLMPPLAEVDDD